MPYIAALVRHRDWEDATWVDLFDVRNDVQDPERALRSAIAEYLATTDGKLSIEHSCDDFNWGDAVLDVTPEIWHKHGLKPRYNDCVIRVDQDEVLIPSSKTASSSNI
jgi:hypothetical protein